MKTLIAVMGLMAGVLLAGCASHPDETSWTMGPMLVDGVTYYPAKPNTIYTNAPADYTTNRPPAGTPDSVTMVTTNASRSIHYRLINGPKAGQMF